MHSPTSGRIFGVGICGLEVDISSGELAGERFQSSDGTPARRAFFSRRRATSAAPISCSRPLAPAHEEPIRYGVDIYHHFRITFRDINIRHCLNVIKQADAAMRTYVSRICLTQQGSPWPLPSPAQSVPLLTKVVHLGPRCLLKSSLPHQARTPISVSSTPRSALAT